MIIATYRTKGLFGSLFHNGKNPLGLEILTATRRYDVSAEAKDPQLELQGRPERVNRDGGSFWNPKAQIHRCTPSNKVTLSRSPKQHHKFEASIEMLETMEIVFFKPSQHIDLFLCLFLSLCFPKAMEWPYIPCYNVCLTINEETTKSCDHELKISKPMNQNKPFPL